MKHQKVCEREDSKLGLTVGGWDCGPNASTRTSTVNRGMQSYNEKTVCQDHGILQKAN